MHQRNRRRSRALAGLALAVAAVLASAGPSTAAGPTGSGGPAEAGARLATALTGRTTVGGVVAHLVGLQRIAETNGGIRTSGSRGYDQSADYVAERLADAGYRVKRQTFEFPFFHERTPTRFRQVAPAPRQYRAESDFQVMEYSGPGNVRAAVHPVDVHLAPPRASTSGCEAADFAGFPRGQIALIQRGTCEFGVKTRNARTAGAAAVVVFNQGNGDPGHDADRFTSVAGTLDGPTTIPVVGVSYAVGAALAATPGTVVEIDADTESETRTTQNLIAESPQGRSDNVVMAGAHLDSVAEGPGINDNGTGSAALLEVALQYAPLAKRFAPVNKVRFAWWGAEEEGLVGSDRYVKQLTPKQVKDIGLYLNFDMLASPNYLLAVQDGNHSSHDSDPAPKGSAAIEKLFRNYLTGRGQHPVDADFDGRSDYGPFIDEDIAIPSGGLETGAEGIKTAADVRLFGGVAGAPFDPCYHKACDSLVPLAHHAPQVTYDRLRHAYGAALLGNVNLTALDLMTGAMADAIGRLAFDTTGISAPAPAPSPAP